MNSKDIIKLFLDEAIEHIEEVSNQLMLLEQDAENEDIIQVLFRSAHTLKGNSTTAYNTLVDFEEEEHILNHLKSIGKITHVFENLIMEVRDSGLKLTPERIELLFEIETVVETLLTYIEQDIPEVFDIEELHEKVQNTILNKNEDVSKKEEINNASLESSDETKNVYELKMSFENPGDEAFKHAFLSMVYVEIRDKFEPLEEGKLLIFSPTFEDLMEGKEFDNIFIQLDKKFDPKETIDFISKINNIASIKLLNADISSEDANETIADSLKQEPEKLKEVEVKIEKEKPISENDSKNTANKINKEISSTKKSAVTKNLMSNTNIRVDIKRIDEVLKHVSSLVILKNKLSTYSSLLDAQEVKILKDISEEISQTVDDLQDSVMKIRMTPLEQLFQRFPKDVRNIAKEYNKKVNFKQIGGATEIDKSLLDNLGNPLIHLIRNSVFHGLETEEERIAAGKDPVGQLTLSAKYEQGRAVITIEDDGKGIDVEKVVEKAIEKKYITAEKAKSLPEEEAIQLIFASGLSTAEKVTSVAGRGVGMDAVKATIEEEMRGTVQVYSKLGQGTKTVIRLPLTLSIIKAMRTKIDDLDFSFPLDLVEEVVSIQPKEIKFVANKEIYILRDKEIPIVRLYEYFNMDYTPDPNKLLNLVLLKNGDKTVAVAVDEFVDKEDIVVKNLGKHLGNLPGISGCNILGDGSISLIVDINTLINN